MNELQIFNNPKFGEIRVTMKSGEPWFIANDACRILEISNPRDALARLDDDEKGVVSTDTLGGKQELNAVNEPGLYSLVLGSRKSEAKEFKRWLTHEVIPAIRKHGAYLSPQKIEEVLLNPDTIIQLATNLKEERAKREKAEQQIEADKPKVLFAESVAVSKGTMLVRELAKLITQNGYEIGERRLHQWLRDNGYLIKKPGKDYGKPTQRAMQQGLFEISETTINHNSGVITTKTTARITGKGQIHFLNKFKVLLAKAKAELIDFGDAKALRGGAAQ